MNDIIKKYLKEIEEQNDIKILLACESGSRAWGFPSPDSDYDIRLIYKHKTDWYLTLTEGKDTIDIMLEDNMLDISGWDLRKTLRLLWKSNPPLFEWIQSPIIYNYDVKFMFELNELAKSCYSRIATIHHYLSMAKKGLDEIENIEIYKLKKFFYALRAASACRWIIDKDDIPPIYFPNLINGLELNSTLKSRINLLIELKEQKNESYLHSGEIELIDFIKESIDLAEINGKQLPAANGDYSLLDTFFGDVVKNYDN
jgi:hypothetical protein